MKQLFLFLAMVLSLSCHAQFTSSEQVYCYVYDYTINDGIKSKKNSTTYYFVNFQNDMMGYVTASGLKNIKQRLMEDPDYYNNAAINNLANSYSRWKRSPAGEPTMGPAQATAQIIKFNSQYSTGSKYTYQYIKKYAQNSGNIWDTYGSQNYWSDPKWQSNCYTFSRDRSEMIVWSTSDSENRDYYKKVDISNLIPNTDFLY